MRRIRPLKNTEVAQMREMVAAGLPSVEIARRIDRSPSTVRKYAGGARPKLDVELIQTLTAAGRSRSYIAAVAGCCERTAWLHGAEIKRRQKAAREERLLRACESAERGGLAPVATRFGYGSVEALVVSACRIRKRRALREAA